MESVFQTEKAARIFRLLLAAVILISAASCSRRDMRVQSVLASADSLMMTRPQAALDTLLSLDSTVVFSLRGRDRADFALLMTEARYKCYLPVAEDTAISEAADYYRRKGPDDRYARALTMQGAVLSERRDPEGAMAAYKEAEPIVERGGDLEQLGLLHTRIGELYQSSIVNNPTAIERDRMALACFEKAGLPERIMYAHVTLARMLMVDSVEKAMPHLEKTLSIAKENGNRTVGLSSYDLYLHAYASLPDYRQVISVAEKALRIYGDTPRDNEVGLYNGIFSSIANAYAEMGISDSARMAADRIVLRTSVDTMNVFSIYAKLAKLEEDWETACRYEVQSLVLADSIKKAGYQTQLAELEKKYEQLALSEKLQKERARIMTLAFATIAIIFLSCVIILFLRKVIKSLKNRNASMHRRICESDEDIRRLAARLSSQLDANGKLLGLYRITHELLENIASCLYIYGNNSELFAKKVSEHSMEYIKENTTLERSKRILDFIYPGFLPRLYADFPKLTERDWHLIVLMCLGYSTEALSYMLKIESNTLYVRQNRLARKMGTGCSLSKYLNGRLSNYCRE